MRRASQRLHGDPSPGAGDSRLLRDTHSCARGRGGGEGAGWRRPRARLPPIPHAVRAWPAEPHSSHAATTRAAIAVSARLPHARASTEANACVQRPATTRVAQARFAIGRSRRAIGSERSGTTVTGTDVIARLLRHHGGKPGWASWISRALSSPDLALKHAGTRRLYRAVWSRVRSPHRTLERSLGLPARHRTRVWSGRAPGT